MYSHDISVTAPCHLSRANLLADLRQYERGLSRIELDTCADDPELSDKAYRAALWQWQGEWITAAMRRDVK